MSDFPLEGGARAGFELLVRALVADLDTVLEALEPEQREELLSLLAGAGDRPATDVLLDLQELLLYADLPADHPVGRALTTARFVRTSTGGPELTPEQSLELLRGAALPKPPPQEPRPGPGAEASSPRPAATEPAQPSDDPQSLPEFGSYESVIRRLTELPALTPDEVRRVGTDPDLPELIRLGHGATTRLPRFQFDGSGAVRPVVVEVNRILDAEHDPWAVAGWWTDLHAWLKRAPVELLDEDGGADGLRELARAEVTD